MQITVRIAKLKLTITKNHASVFFCHSCFLFSDTECDAFGFVCVAGAFGIEMKYARSFNLCGLWGMTSL